MNDIEKCKSKRYWVTLNSPNVPFHPDLPVALKEADHLQRVLPDKVIVIYEIIVTRKLDMHGN